MDPTTLLTFGLISLTVAMTPGASWLYVITARVRDGGAGGAAALAGNATGILCHTLLAAVGLSAILQYSTPVFTGIKVAGALYLAWLGVHIIRGRPSRPQANPDPAYRDLARIWRDGALMNLLNPKAALLLLAVLPQFVDSDGSETLPAFAVLGATHAVIASVVLSAVAMFAGATGQRIAWSAARTRALRWITGTIMFGFACALLLASQNTVGA